MSEDRLMTDEEIWELIAGKTAWPTVETQGREICKAQDAKTYPLAFEAGRKASEKQILMLIEESGEWSKKVNTLEDKLFGKAREITQLEAQAEKDRAEIEKKDEYFEAFRLESNKEFQQAVLEAEKRGAGELALLAKEVMDLLQEHGKSIVPHLLDNDENAGEQLRQSISEVLGQSKLKSLEER